MPIASVVLAVEASLAVPSLTRSAVGASEVGVSEVGAALVLGSSWGGVPLEFCVDAGPLVCSVVVGSGSAGRRTDGIGKKEQDAGSDRQTRHAQSRRSSPFNDRLFRTRLVSRQGLQL